MFKERIWIMHKLCFWFKLYFLLYKCINIYTIQTSVIQKGIQKEDNVTFLSLSPYCEIWHTNKIIKLTDVTDMYICLVKLQYK